MKHMGQNQCLHNGRVEGDMDMQKKERMYSASLKLGNVGAAGSRTLMIHFSSNLNVLPPIHVVGLSFLSTVLRELPREYENLTDEKGGPTRCGISVYAAARGSATGTASDTESRSTSHA